MREPCDDLLRRHRRRERVLPPGEDEHRHVDVGERRDRVGPVSQRLDGRDQILDRLVGRDLACPPDDRLGNVGREKLGLEILPERVEAVLAQPADRLAARRAARFVVCVRAGVRKDHGGDSLRRLAPQLESEVAAHRDSDGYEVAGQELEDARRPTREARVRLVPGQVRRDHLVAGLLERGHLPFPHPRVERKGVQQKEDGHSRGRSTASGISAARA